VKGANGIMLELQQKVGVPGVDLGGLTLSFPSSFLRSSQRRSSAARPPKRKLSDSVQHKHLGFEEVLARLKRGQHLTPNDAAAAFNLGLAYKWLGRWTDSANAFTVTLTFLGELDDKDSAQNLATVYFGRGYAYASQATKHEGRARSLFEKAEADYLKALQLKNDYAEVYCYLGVLYDLQHRWAEAERVFKKAIKLEPNYAGAYHDLGVTYSQRGLPKLALKSFEKAVALEPKNLLFLEHVAEMHYEARRWSEAKKVLVRILKLDPHDQDALYKLGSVNLNLGQFRDAKKALQKVLQLDPKDPIAYGNLGLVYFRAHEFGKATEAFRTAIELGHPDEESIRGNLNAIQISLIDALCEQCVETLTKGDYVDLEGLVDVLGAIRSATAPTNGNVLTLPTVYFPNQLIGVFSPIVDHLDEDARFQFAALLFERRLLSSGKASRLIRMPRRQFLETLPTVGVAMIELTPNEFEEELHLATAE
jgi:tetratricopeptide (TPR) repeat protein